MFDGPIIQGSQIIQGSYSYESNQFRLTYHVHGEVPLYYNHLLRVPVGLLLGCDGLCPILIELGHMGLAPLPGGLLAGLSTGGRVSMGEWGDKESKGANHLTRAEDEISPREDVIRWSAPGGAIQAGVDDLPLWHTAA